MKWHFLLAMVVLLNGCTVYYKPVSAWEMEVHKQASFNIYPDDVRSNIASHRNKTVAWAGVLEKVHIDERSSPAVMELEIKHHFFSWTMDGGSRKYWLSPKGEGHFRTSWPMEKGWDLDKMRELILIGDMVVVYGTPTELSKNIINLGQAQYIRHLPKAAFKTDVVEYGRPGDPIKTLGLGSL